MAIEQRQRLIDWTNERMKKHF